jgi:cell wall-associated NlpC family hydrolase
MATIVYKLMIFLIESGLMRSAKYILVLWMALACGFAQAAESSSEESATFSQVTAEWTNIAQEVLMNALSLTGVKYTYGGKSPETGFDCSGFVKYVFQQAANLTLPHGARAISQLGQSIPVEQLQPGDLVFFDTLKNAFSHVGIYMGDGRFIHAPTTGGGVRVVNMNDSYWAKRFNGARRLPVSAQQPVAVSAE